ncbi:MAG: roadblock/LC7 domain-containing protein [Candidatus Thermoplasmatota archaeon]
MRQIESIMKELRRIPDVLAVAVARRDGILVAPDLPRGVDGRKVAAMSAALVGTSEFAARELGQGRFLQLIVDTDQGKILSTGAGEEALLVTLVRTGANLGLILLAVDKAARKLAALFAGGLSGDSK